MLVCQPSLYIVNCNHPTDTAHLYRQGTGQLTPISDVHVYVYYVYSPQTVVCQEPKLSSTSSDSFKTNNLFDSSTNILNCRQVPKRIAKPEVENLFQDSDTTI